MWGNPLEGCCTLAQKHSPSIASLMGCGMEKNISCSRCTPKSADSIPGGFVSLLTALTILAQTR